MRSILRCLGCPSRGGVDEACGLADKGRQSDTSSSETGNSRNRMLVKTTSQQVSERSGPTPLSTFYSAVDEVKAHRDALVLEHSHSLVTVVSLAPHGGARRVLHQNVQSAAYMGQRTVSRHVHSGSGGEEGHVAPAHVAGNVAGHVEGEEDVLEQLFSRDPAKLDALLLELTREGGIGQWKGIVRMPPAFPPPTPRGPGPASRAQRPAEPSVSQLVCDQPHDDPHELTRHHCHEDPAPTAHPSSRLTPNSPQPSPRGLAASEAGVATAAAVVTVTGTASSTTTGGKLPANAWHRRMSSLGGSGSSRSSNQQQQQQLLLQQQQQAAGAASRVGSRTLGQMAVILAASRSHGSVTAPQRRSPGSALHLAPAPREDSEHLEEAAILLCDPAVPHHQQHQPQSREREEAVVSPLLISPLDGLQHEEDVNGAWSSAPPAVPSQEQLPLASPRTLAGSSRLGAPFSDRRSPVLAHSHSTPIPESGPAPDPSGATSTNTGLGYGNPGTLDPQRPQRNRSNELASQCSSTLDNAAQLLHSGAWATSTFALSLTQSGMTHGSRRPENIPASIGSISFKGRHNSLRDLTARTSARPTIPTIHSPRACSVSFSAGGGGDTGSVAAAAAPPPPADPLVAALPDFPSRGLDSAPDSPKPSRIMAFASSLRTAPHTTENGSLLLGVGQDSLTDGLPTPGGFRRPQLTVPNVSVSHSIFNTSAAFGGCAAELSPQRSPHSVRCRGQLSLPARMTSATPRGGSSRRWIPRPTWSLNGGPATRPQSPQRSSQLQPHAQQSLRPGTAERMRLGSLGGGVSTAPEAEASGGAAAAAAAELAAPVQQQALPGMPQHGEQQLAEWGEGEEAMVQAEEEAHGGEGLVVVPEPSSPVMAALAAAATSYNDSRWHEVWATRAVDPVTGQDVIVLSQHDVTAKVLAERHLALVMETEHRLLEQLFPRHILQHITEEFTSAVEPAAPGANATALSAATGGAGGGAHAIDFWRPGVRDYTRLATWHEEVTLLFADIKGFTPMCSAVPPAAVMAMLNDLFTRFDALLDVHGVFKVETIGDCYFVAGGLIKEDECGMAAVRSSYHDPMHAEKVFMFAKAMLEAASQVTYPTGSGPVEIRIGIHSGPVVSGVVGTRMPRFCLFGDTVNTASRMESSGTPGAIHASEAAHALLPSEGWEPCGGMEVKGKGNMSTYLWRPAPKAPPALAESALPGMSRSTTIRYKEGTSVVPVPDEAPVEGL